MKRLALLAAGLTTIVLGFLGGNYFIKWLNNDADISVAAQTVVSHARPSFTLPDIEGVAQPIGTWNGRVLAINFWATWCAPCRREIPALIKLQQHYGEQGLQIIGVAIDDAEAVNDYIKATGVNYPILLGEQDAIQVAIDYGNEYGILPYTAIVDRQGYIAFVQAGELSLEQVEKAIKPLL